ncbi:MAG: hypothetical protein AAGA66_04265 [Bacteroidota bacterium]
MRKQVITALFSTMAFLCFTSCDEGCDENEIECQRPDGTQYCCDAPWLGNSLPEVGKNEETSANH